MPLQVATTYLTATLIDGDDIGVAVESTRAEAATRLGGESGVLHVHQVDRLDNAVGICWRRVWNDDPPPVEE